LLKIENHKREQKRSTESFRKMSSSRKSKSKKVTIAYEDIEPRDIINTKKIWQEKYEKTGRPCFRFAITKKVVPKSPPSDPNATYIYVPTQFWINCERWACITLQIANTALTRFPHFKKDKNGKPPRNVELQISRVDASDFDGTDYVDAVIPDLDEDSDEPKDKTWVDRFVRVNNELWEALDFLDLQYNLFVSSPSSSKYSARAIFERDAPDLLKFCKSSAGIRTGTRRKANPGEGDADVKRDENGYIDIDPFHRLSMPIYSNPRDKKYHMTLSQNRFVSREQRVVKEYVMTYVDNDNSDEELETKPLRHKKKVLTPETLRLEVPKFSAVNINVAINQTVMTGAYISLKWEVKLLERTRRHRIMDTKTTKSKAQKSGAKKLRSTLKSLGKAEEFYTKDEAEIQEDEYPDSSGKEESDSEPEDEPKKKRKQKKKGTKLKVQPKEEPSSAEEEGDSESEEEEPIQKLKLNKKSKGGKKLKKSKPEPESESEQESEEESEGEESGEEVEEPPKKSKKKKDSSKKAKKSR
jgi:hypothetical protein